MANRDTVRFAANKHTALAITRALRAGGKADWTSKRVELIEPDPGKAGRWSAHLFDLSRFGLPSTPSWETPMHVAVPHAKHRLRVKDVESTVYSSGLPREAFVDVGEGLSIAGPELLFVEMAVELSPIEHLLLGMELLGTFALDAVDPQDNAACCGISPATTLAKLACFMENAHGVKGLARARKTLNKLVENAWSPAEALIAALMVLPAEDDGYAMGPIALSGCVSADGTPGQASWRIPDIVFIGSSVGLSYDGGERLGVQETRKVADAAAVNPETLEPARRLDRVIEDA